MALSFRTNFMNIHLDTGTCIIHISCQLHEHIFASYVAWDVLVMCNQCLSTLKLWVRNPFMARCTQYKIMW